MSDPHCLPVETAQAKTCPFEFREGRNCLGDKCMAWRWGHDAWLTHAGKVIQTHVAPEHGDRGNWIKQGYCQRLEPQS